MVEWVKPSKLILALIIMMHVFINAQNSNLYVLHTNNTNGALENCYCPDHPFGAVEKRSIYFSNFIEKHPNTIIVDAGDIFTMSKQTLKDSLMAEAYSYLPYDILLYGDQELIMDNNKLGKLTRQMGIPVLGTNIDRSQLIKSKLLKRGDVTVAIMGIIDPYSIKYYPIEVRDKIKLSNPVNAIKAEMAKLKNKADVFILLTHQGEDLDIATAKKIKGLDLIVGAHSQSLIEKPKEVNGTLIAQAGKSGYYVGVVTLGIKNKKVNSKAGRIDTMKFEMPDDPRIMKLIEEYEAKSGRINRNKQKLKSKK